MSIAMPDGDWRWLRDEVNRLKTEARYASKRKEGRVIHGVELFGLGLTLCELARRSRPELARTATLFRDGLIFLTLAIAPARVSSFLAIEIGEHLDLEGPKAMLRWGADETKEDRPERYPVWPIVRKHIEEYLAVYRPVLARSYSGTELWVASDGRGPLSYAALWKAVHVQSLKYLGIAYSPHLARDTVALTVSEELPEAMEIATAMLHHASSKSTEPYRHQANTISASRVARRMQQQARERAKRTLREAEINPQPQAVDEIFAKYA
jgi:integrase